MKKIYRLENGEAVDPIQHTIEVLHQHKDVKIYIGTDSQNKRRMTHYVTVIAYRYGTRGAHYIYSRNKVKFIKDMWTRLWGELEYSLEIAKILRDNSIHIECIELDLNEKKIEDSNIQLAAAAGLVRGIGFRPNFKIDDSLYKEREQGEGLLIAAKAADHLVRR